MKLSLVRAYLSLVSLPNQEIPDFTLITGVNGAGKSHLLKALQNGAAICDVAPDTIHDVRLFDWTNLVPNGEGEFSSDTIRQEQTGIYNQFKNLLDQPWGLSNLLQVAASIGLRGSLLSNAQKLLSASDEDLINNTEGNKDISFIRSNINNAALQFENGLWGNLPNSREHIENLSKITNKRSIALKQSDFLNSSQPDWGKTEIFQQSFGRLFVSYRDLYLSNRVAQLDKAEGNTSSNALTEIEFREKYGSPPWEFVNSSLAAAGMAFTINSPDKFSLGLYKPVLIKSSSDAEISFDGLSSGERILMSFAFALYYSSDNRQIISRPKLLLLDEIDAPLHPSMCKKLISTIQQVLVKEQGLKVIMTTHSPSTVALAPEDAIYVMRPGQPGIHKVTKDIAIKDLTDGVPTLSIFYEGRRQVFVESPKDVEVYQAAFNALKHYINSEISIVFIATGIETSEKKHINTGCDIVKRIVNNMREAGAKHTLGLIDWDGKNKEEDGIIVLGKNERDGLESVFFDPLLLLNTLVRETKIGHELLSKEVTYISLVNLDVSIIQHGVDEIQKRVLRRDRMESISVSYAGGLKLMIDKNYLIMDDHNLESQVYAAFPQLNSISRNRAGELMKWISRTILNERPEHSPVALLEAFKRIVDIC